MVTIAEGAPLAEPTNPDTPPGDCPTGMCGRETVATYDPQGALGPMDEANGHWDPAEGLTLMEVVQQKGPPFLKFWFEVMNAYEAQFGREARIQITQMFAAGEGRDWFYEIEWHTPNDPYTIWYWESGDFVSNRGVEQFFGADGQIVGFATQPSNAWRGKKIIHFYQDVDEESLPGNGALAARRLQEAVSIEQDFDRWVSIAGDIAVIALTAVALVSGVGGVIAAASWSLRAAALVVLAFDLSDAVQVGTGYLGANQGQGYNVLEEAAAYLGRGLADSDGETAARTAYHTINLAVGLNGKWRALAIVPAGMTYGNPAALFEPSQDEADELHFWEE